MQAKIMPLAWSDLANIGDYIAESDRARARTFVRELQEACEGLGAGPERYAVVPRYLAQQVRSRSYGRYIIFYRIKNQVVEVLRIVHGARDLTKLFR